MAADPDVWRSTASCCRKTAKDSSCVSCAAKATTAATSGLQPTESHGQDKYGQQLQQLPLNKGCLRRTADAKHYSSPSLYSIVVCWQPDLGLLPFIDMPTDLAQPLQANSRFDNELQLEVTPGTGYCVSLMHGSIWMSFMHAVSMKRALPSRAAS